MQNNNNCLQEAMIIASESYSGSAYESHVFDVMEADCVDRFINRDEKSEMPAMTA